MLEGTLNETCFCVVKESPDPIVMEEVIPAVGYNIRNHVGETPGMKLNFETTAVPLEGFDQVASDVFQERLKLSTKCLG
jgi:hypothetical protein